MATFTAILTTSAPATPQVYARVLSGSPAAPTTSVARSAMTAEVTVGGDAVWSLSVTWDNAWVSPRVVYDDGATCWPEGQVIANVAQVNGAGASPVSGAGDTLTNHNTGGVDNLRYVNEVTGNPIDGAYVAAYEAAAYASNPLTAEVKGQAYTNVLGRWVSPMMLEAVPHVFVFTATGYETETMTATPGT